MNRRPPWTSSMIAMALLACGESSARAAPVDEQEQKRMEWAHDRAVSRIYSVEEMRQYLRNCGDDEARAEENLPQLDAWTLEMGCHALSLLTAVTQQRKTSNAEKRHRFTQQIEGAYGVPYADAAQQVAANLGGEAVGRWYRDGKLIKEVRGQRLAVSLMESSPVMLVPYPEGPRPPAKPRSKSGQRRAHARRGR